MKLTIGTYDIADYLVADTYNAWTRSGSLAMAEWLEQMEEDSGIEMEFNACEIRCEYSEYKSVMEAAGEYGCRVCRANGSGRAPVLGRKNRYLHIRKRGHYSQVLIINRL
jgi:hypothetical protein